MQSAIPAQERPARIALTVVVNCVNPTRKPVAGVTDLLFFLLDLPSGKPEASVSGSRTTAAKKSLKITELRLRI